ncbi:DUF4263 domain-containing protein [Microbacterium sp. NC79]|nr:DUF4263 domain-containing protein [Microbacterium sp. NC79]
MQPPYEADQWKLEGKGEVLVVGAPNDDAFDDATRRAWESLKSSDCEAKVQEFLERHVALLPGAWGEFGSGGHHGPMYSAVFRQPPLQGLDSTRVPDFMWIPRSTVEITPVCIEIERPTKRWFTKDGTPTAQLTQALDQLNQWRSWFSEALNQQLFRENYLKNRWPRRVLKPQFVLIYGRESDFTEDHKLSIEARHSKRIYLGAGPDVHLRTFDSLRWNSHNENLVTVSASTSGRFRVEWVPKSFDRLGDPTGAHYLGPIENAIAQNSEINSVRAGEILAAWTKERSAGRRIASGDTYLGSLPIPTP